MWKFFLWMAVAVSLVAAGTLRDSRDGRIYRTAKVGDQAWMAENLNYKVSGSYCYDGDERSCEKFGRLYTWAAAMDSAGTFSAAGKGCGYRTVCAPTGTVRGICPEGWHLPSKKEFETLIRTVGGENVAGKKLKSKSGWNEGGNGSDDFGFSALAAGAYNWYGYFFDVGDLANFWSATEYGSNDAYILHLIFNLEYAYLRYNGQDNAFSVRCVGD